MDCSIYMELIFIVKIVLIFQSFSMLFYASVLYYYGMINENKVFIGDMVLTGNMVYSYVPTG